MKTKSLKVMVLTFILTIMFAQTLLAPPFYSKTRLVGSDDSYFKNQDLTALTTYYVQFEFGFYSTGIKLINRTTNYLEISYDGINKDDEILSKEYSVTDNKSENDIWIRAEKNGQAYTLTVW